MDLIRKILSFRTLVAAGMGMGLSTACATGDMPEGRVGMSCYVDGDCPGDLRCVSQMCVEPAAAAMGDDDEDDDSAGADDDDGPDDDDDDDSTGADDDDDDDDSAGDDDDDDAPEPLPPGECHEEGDDCESSSQCCGYADDPESGDGVCIDNADAGTVSCTSWCESHGDCESNCCASVSDSDLGACIEASACEEFYACVDGVQLFCTCEILAGGDCTDEEIEQYVSACSSGTDSSYFECMAPYYVDTDDIDVLEGQCAEATPACGEGPSGASGAPASTDIDVFAAEAKLPQLRVDMLALQ